MLIVISPAKSLNLTSPLPELDFSQPMLLEESQVLIEQLQQLSPHDISNLMRISDKLGLLNFDRFQAWQRPFDLSNARPAVLTFNGEVYQGLNAYDLEADDLAFAQSRLRILSGLYGLLRPLDLIQPYRLEMGIRLKNPAGRDLYAYWTDRVTAEIRRQLERLQSNTLINLASAEYFKAIETRKLGARVIEPVFKDLKNGQYRIINFYAKKARGLMSAYILRNRITDSEAIKGFDSEGYEYRPELSTDERWLFTREER